MNIEGNGVLKEIEEHSVGFSLAFIIFFTLCFVFLSITDVLPDPAGAWNREHGGTALALAQNDPEAQNAPQQSVAQGELPMRVIIDAISLNSTISNPASTDIETLDNALLSGAVRYPTSGELGVDGTVLLFGHSSYLPIVHNQAYKAFDGIQNLKTGDEISVYSSTKEYRYRVVGVRTANAGDDDQNTIALGNDAQHLVLVTCDSFGTKSDRFVVNADFVGTYSLAR